jgi:hypothetical protein
VESTTATLMLVSVELKVRPASVVRPATSNQAAVTWARSAPIVIWFAPGRNTPTEPADVQQNND